MHSACEKRRATVTCGLLVGLAVVLSPVVSADPPRVGVNPGAPLWGGNILFTSQLAADMEAVGCRAVRINFRLDGNAAWTPAHLAKYDQIIANARNHGLSVLGLVCYEAVPGGQSDWNQNYNTTGLNPYITTFANTAYLLINRYKADVKHWELWNEPDCWSVPPESNPLQPGCFYIWPKNYANLLAETYKACLTQGGADFFSANGLSLCTGGLFAHDIGGSFSTSMAYMNNVYNQNGIWNAFEAVAGRRYPWDLFGYHFYLNQGEPVSTSELAAYFNDVRYWKGVHNDPAPILVTEFGWNTQSVSQSLQATNLRDTYNWMRTQPDVQTGYWYQWNDGDGGWGLVSGSGPKPAYYEFQAQCGPAVAPVASFSAAPLTGEAPLTVQFTSTSTGVITTYLWTFGDGGTSAAPNPVHTYATRGRYTVTLAVTGPGGSDTAVRGDYVVVTSRADFDLDNDVDLADFARFARCFAGGGNPTPPPGCDCAGSGASPAAATGQLAAGLGGLSAAISSFDLLQARIGTLEAGGFHEATPGGTPGGLADLTDGVAGSTPEAVLADYARPALQVRYELVPPTSLAEIRVFAANADGRVFQNYDVEVAPAGDAAFHPLLRDVRAGALGAVNNGQWGASLTRITPTVPGPIAVNIDALRFVFYDVSTVSPAGTFWDAWDAGEPRDADGAPRAYVASILKEIDVFEWTGPLPAVNCVDLDGDRDADRVDFGILVGEWSGPG